MKITSVLFEINNHGRLLWIEIQLFDWYNKDYWYRITGFYVCFQQLEAVTCMLTYSNVKWMPFHPTLTYIRNETAVMLCWFYYSCDNSCAFTCNIFKIRKTRLFFKLLSPGKNISLHRNKCIHCKKIFYSNIVHCSIENNIYILIQQRYDLFFNYTTNYK